MKICCVCPIESINFGELELSDTFWFNTAPHMKMKNSCGANNVINLQTGECLYLTEGTIVLFDTSLKIVNGK